MFDELTGLEEHMAFEAGAEDMELRAMRMEAEREAAMDAACSEAEGWWGAYDAAVAEGFVGDMDAFKAQVEADTARARVEAKAAADREAADREADTDEIPF